MYVHTYYRDRIRFCSMLVERFSICIQIYIYICMYTHIHKDVYIFMYIFQYMRIYVRTTDCSGCVSVYMNI